ncbi:transposase [Micromonospora sp. NPDC093277]|uniref:transposase n=1 Tax=Micromonospora sp. NPDC093277 TaxID=3364291 RepID=UPI003813D90E
MVVHSGTASIRARALRQPAGVEEALGRQVSALLTQYNATAASAQTLWDHLEPMLADHPHTPIYRSFPGLGPLLAARLLGELGDDPQRFPTARSLRAFCAATPITWASGTSYRASHRRKANPILAESGHLWAFSALTRSPGARALYDRRRDAGDRHAAALRRIYAHLLGSLHHCLRHGIHYDESRAFPQPQPQPDPGGDQPGQVDAGTCPGSPRAVSPRAGNGTPASS